MVHRQVLLEAFDEALSPGDFNDYGPNGLQVEGKAQIGRIVSGVTASLALIDAAIAARADAIFVHHGLFWRGQSGVVTGWMKQRLTKLLVHEINLFAYHLPLDAHPTLGNNAQLGERLGLVGEGRFGAQNLGWVGVPADGKAFVDGRQLADRLQRVLAREPLVLGHTDTPLHRIAWCTGGAQGFFEDAIAAGAQAYITGEVSEPQAHLARECGVLFFAAGHHATERYGAPAMAASMAARFGLEHEFIEIDNPA